MAGDLELYIWNYNHSSWSMRAGIPLRQTGVKFREVVAHSAPEALAAVKAKTPTGLLPALAAGGQVIWDSLAIAEFLAEEFPDAGLWPKDKAARAHARSMVAEMHSGFSALREHLPMNIAARYPGHYKNAATLREIRRVVSMWEDCLQRFGGGPFLCGPFGLVDAFYAPVVMRFTSYDVQLPLALAEYCEAVRTQPFVADWIRLAHTDPTRNPAYHFER